MDKSHEYILKVGNKAAERLRLLDEIYGPYTHEFLNRIGLMPHFEILEVGCGTGNISCWMAQQLGSQGKVTGVDISAEQIQIAREQAREKNIKNIEFIELSVFDLNKLNTQFDLVFSRFLLVHLSDPGKALLEMYDRVKPNGILGCDEQSLASARCYPPSKALNSSIELCYKLTQQKGLDFNFGERLYFEFQKLNLKKIQGRSVQPVLISAKQKMMLVMFFQEARNAFLAAQIIDEKEFDQMTEEILREIKNENCYFLPMQNFQFWGVK